MSERGVSEVLGFVIVFSMILLMTGVVYLGGASELREIRDDQQVEGVERAFVAIDSDISDLVRDGAPSRTSTIRLNTGELTYGNETRVVVTKGGTEVRNTTVQPMVYRFDGEPRLVYVMGMVARSGGDGDWVMVREPPMLVDENALIPYIDLVPADERRVEGARSVTIRTAISGTVVGSRTPGRQYTMAGGGEVAVNITGTPRAALWERHFEENPIVDNCDSVKPRGRNCTFTADRLRVPKFTVEVALN